MRNNYILFHLSGPFSPDGLIDPLVNRGPLAPRSPEGSGTPMYLIAQYPNQRDKYIQKILYPNDKFYICAKYIIFVKNLKGKLRKLLPWARWVVVLQKLRFVTRQRPFGDATGPPGRDGEGCSAVTSADPGQMSAFKGTRFLTRHVPFGKPKKNTTKNSTF